VVALGSDGDSLEASSSRETAHRHGAHLLEQIDEVLAQTGRSLDEIDAVAVGTGPGSFTGLRVGLATAKTIAYARSLPLIAVVSSQALRTAATAQGAAAETVVVLPAGARDHYLAAPDADARLVPPDALEAELGSRSVLTVDMEPESLGAAAAALGAAALAGLPAALLALAAQRLSTGGADDIDELEPVYVALPRGVTRHAEELGWSPDLR
jgi:tRNA threonylcarbamoyl adenosine modification protein YeaZ